MINNTKQAEDDLMYKHLYGDIVGANIDLKEEKMGLVNLTFPNTVKLLEDPSIWVVQLLYTTLHTTGIVPNNS